MYDNFYDVNSDWIPQTPRDHFAHFLGGVENFGVLNSLSAALDIEPLFDEDMTDDMFTGAIDLVANLVEENQCFGAAINAVVKDCPEARQLVPPALLHVAVDAERNRSGTHRATIPFISFLCLCTVLNILIKLLPVLNILVKDSHFFPFLPTLCCLLPF
jgi:hypothetical protein